MVDEPAHERASAQAGGARLIEDLGQTVGAADVGTTTEAVQFPNRRRIVPAFDGHHPPEMQMLNDCVHCGFCLPTCPTYVLFGEEMDSPRGRIYLMRQAQEGGAMTNAMVGHWDQCLGCLACVTACPSGVQYDKLLESTRQQVERRYPRNLLDRTYRAAIYRLFPYRERLQVLMAPLRLYQRSGLQGLVRGSGLLRLLPRQLQSLEALTPPAPAHREFIPAWTPAQGAQRYKVGVLLGCVQGAFFPDLNAATVRVLAAEGCGVAAPAQGCCGALSAHVGREAEAMRFARRTIDVFDAADVEAVIVNVAGCGSVMKEYGYLLRDDPAYAQRAQAFSSRVRDVSEFLSDMEPIARRHPLPLSAVYHDACHLSHGQRITSQPRALLHAIPQLEVHEVPREREICCGSAGTYNLLQPEPASQLGQRKARNVAEVRADLLITSNPGCQLQIGAHLRDLGRPMPAAHLVQVLDASIRGTAAETLL